MQGKVTVEYLGYYLYIEMKQMKRLRQYCSAGATVTLVTRVLVTSGLGAGPGYHGVKTSKLGGDERWDYLTVDDPSNQLHISPSTHVMSK